MEYTKIVEITDAITVVRKILNDNTKNLSEGIEWNFDDGWHSACMLPRFKHLTYMQRHEIISSAFNSSISFYEQFKHLDWNMIMNVQTAVLRHRLDALFPTSSVKRDNIETLFNLKKQPVVDSNQFGISYENIKFGFTFKPIDVHFNNAIPEVVNGYESDAVDYVQNKYRCDLMQEVCTLQRDIMTLFAKLSNVRKTIAPTEFMNLCRSFSSTSKLRKAKFEPPSFTFQSVRECDEIIEMFQILLGYDNKINTHFDVINGGLIKHFADANHSLNMLNVYVLKYWVDLTGSLDGWQLVLVDFIDGVPRNQINGLNFESCA